MFNTDKQIIEKINLIINDEEDNDIVFITAHKGVGKTELLDSINNQISCPETIFADGKEIVSNASSLNKAFVDGILSFLSANNSFENRRIVCDRFRRDFSLFQYLRCRNNLSVLIDTYTDKLCALSLSELKKIYCELAKKTPLVIISSAMTLSFLEIDYLCNLKTDNLGAKVTFIIGISVIPSNISIVSEILAKKGRGVFILPLQATIIEDSNQSDPRSIASIEVKGESNGMVRIDDTTVWNNSLNIDIYHIVKELVKDGLNPQVLPLMANQEVTRETYEYVREITDQIYGEQSEGHEAKLVLQNDGKILWIDVLSYYLLMKKGIDKAIVATQDFFCKVINLIILDSEQEEKGVVFENRLRKSFPAFAKEMSLNRHANLVAKGFEQYYADLAVLSKIAYLRDTNNSDLPNYSHCAVAVLERVASDFSEKNLHLIEQIYDTAQICSILDIGLKLIAEYVLLIDDIDSEVLFHVINHFMILCINEMNKWNDMTMLQEIVNALDSLNKKKIPIFTYSDIQELKLNSAMKTACINMLNDRAIDYKELVMVKSVNDSLISYWNKQGHINLKHYKELISTAPQMPAKIFPEEELDKHLSDCEFILLTATKLEDRIITNGITESFGSFYKISSDAYTYDFFEFNGHKIVHLVPLKPSAYREHGAADALRYTYKHIGDPKNIKGIIGVGIAYGSNHLEQEFGDVLISERIVSWDSFFKTTDGLITLSPDIVHSVGERIIAGPGRYLENYHLSNSYKCYLGTMLCGPAVISDEVFRDSLCEAASKIGITNVIGGEMEGSGIWFESKDFNIPMTIVKGICDWGAMKNSWGIVTDNSDEQNLIKDSIQAYACMNAFETCVFIMKFIFGDQ